MTKLQVFLLIVSLNVLLCSGSPLATGKELAVVQGSEGEKREPRQAGGCGCNLIVYDHSNYQGRSLLIKQQNADFNNDYFNDRVESARVEGTCRWLLYEHTNFVGQTAIINAHDYNSYISWGGNGNRVSSARALPPAGTEAIVLFQHTNFQGRMLVLYDSHDNLPAIDFNDHLSSFIVTGGNWRLYQHTQYSGSRATYGPGDYASQLAIGNDQLSSVRKL